MNTHGQQIQQESFLRATRRVSPQESLVRLPSPTDRHSTCTVKARNKSRSRPSWDSHTDPTPAMDAYTKYALKDIEKCFKRLHFLKLLPYRWDFSTAAPYISQKTEPGYWWWLLQVAISFAFSSFSVCMFGASITQEGWETPTQVKLGIMFPVYCTPLLALHLTSAVIGDDIVDFFKQARAFLLKDGPLISDGEPMRAEDRSESPNSGRDSHAADSARRSDGNTRHPDEDGGEHRTEIVSLLKKLYWFLRLRCIGLRTNLALLFAFVLGHPESPELITSVITTEPHGLKKTAAISTIQGLYFTYLVTLCEGMLLYTSIFESCIFWTLVRIENERSKVKYGCSLKRQFAAYEGMLLFQDRLNILASYFVPVSKLIICITSIGGLYGVARLNGIFRLFCGVYGIDTMAMLCTMLFVLADIETRASKWHKDMEEQIISRGYHAWARKKLRALRPIRCSVGGMYYVDKMLIFTVLDVVLQQSIAVLLLEN